MVKVYALGLESEKASLSVLQLVLAKGYESALVFVLGSGSETVSLLEWPSGSPLVLAMVCELALVFVLGLESALLLPTVSVYGSEKVLVCVWASARRSRLKLALESLLELGLVFALVTAQQFALDLGSVLLKLLESVTVEYLAVG